MRIAAQMLDSTYGQSAVGVQAHLQHASGTGWTTVADAITDSEGRIEDWHGWRQERGLYRLVFDSDNYFASLGANTAYPEVIIMFRMVNEADNCQVQVTICPYSYSTYFGSIDHQKSSS